MAISLAEVRRLVQLAHLEFPENEDQQYLFSEEKLSELRNDIVRFLEHVNDLQSVDVSNVPPASHGVPIPTRLRKDAAEPTRRLEQLISAAPATDGRSFIVPKVVE